MLRADDGADVLKIEMPGAGRRDQDRVRTTPDLACSKFHSQSYNLDILVDV
jgi:crotonobetainyl-CoA:carnitine CoA-transferase CaiB-like acyl-CoA transferase